MWYSHTHTHTHIYTEEEYYVSQKKRMKFCRLRGYYPKWNKSKTNSLCYDFISETGKVQQTSECNKKETRVTDTEKKLVLQLGREKVGRGNTEMRD